MTLGSCTFAIAGSTFAAEHALQVDAQIRIDPCDVDIVDGRLLAQNEEGARSESAPPTEVANLAPVVITPGDQDGDEGDPVSLRIVASDVNGDSLTFSSPTDLPPGLSLDALTGRITGTLAHTAAEGSPYTVEIAVADASDSASVGFTWTVGQALWGDFRWGEARWSN